MYSEICKDDSFDYYGSNSSTDCPEESLKIKSRICKALLRVFKHKVNVGWAGWKVVDFQNEEVTQIFNEVTDHIFEHSLSPTESQFVDELVEPTESLTREMLWNKCTTYYFEDEFVSVYQAILFDRLSPYFIHYDNAVEHMNTLSVKPMRKNPH